jgi:ABC-type transporter Mla subunit MlaD
MLDQLDGLSQESRAGLSTFHAHDPDLANITTNLAITSNRLAQSHQQLGDFVANTADVAGTLASQDQQLSALIYHLANTMNDFDDTLNGNEQNFHQTVVQLDPLITAELVPTLTTVNGYTHPNIGQLQTGFNELIPWIGSAISQQDANGNYLRQYLINDCQLDHSCPQQPAAPNAPAAPNTQLPGVQVPQLPCPTPPIKVPTPTPIPTICPIPTPTPLPCGPTPTPTKTPSPSPTPSLPIPCPSVPGASVPSLPQPLTGLVSP